MPPRRAKILEDTTITLSDGKKVQTKYHSERKRHIVTCDVCNETVSLTATANPVHMEQHLKYCKRQQERQSAKKFRIAEVAQVPEGEGSFQLQLLFPPTSFEANNMTNWNKVECPGQWVPWPPGSIWDTYPFRLHKSKDVGWKPISFDDAYNGVVVRARQCWKWLDEIDSEDSPNPCTACKEVPHTVEFRNVVERAQSVKDHTPWMYLTDQQKETLMRQMANTIRRLRTQINNSTRSRRMFRSRIQEYKRIMMLIASNDIPRLTQLLSVALHHGSSAAAITRQIQRAIDGLYSPRGGFTQHDLDVAFICQALGGTRLLYTMGKKFGMASARTIRRNKLVPRLLPSVGVPTAEEVKQNISAFLDPSIKPPPTVTAGQIPGNTLGFDGISIQKKCRYCPKRGVILGLCREHSKNVDTLVTDSTVIGKIWDGLESTDEETKLCWGSEATVVVVAPYCQVDHYSPTPLVLSPTDKTEKGIDLSRWIQTVIDTWNAHPNGAIQNGPLWSIASDGDATFRQARSELCNRYRLDSSSELGRKLEPLLGLNIYTSKELITATCDPKHIFKRFATLLRSTGITIKNHLISPNDIREQLIKSLDKAPSEVNDIMNSQDKQNVPKAVKLLRYLNTLPNVHPPSDDFSRLRYEHICFIAKMFSFFLEPFIDVRMNLDEQLRSLSTFSHLAVALQLEHGAAFLGGPLYADTQAIVKNIFFVVARLQLISPELTFYLIHEGTDRLERLFGDCRTLDHGRNFDILQLSEKMAIATLINSTFERNPDLDRGHRRLDLSSTVGVDHVNPRSWLGDTHVGQVDLTAVWNDGRNMAIEVLESLFGVDKVQSDFNFKSIFAKSNRDILRPNGVYIGVRPTNDELQREESDHTPVAQNIQTTHTQPEELYLEEGLEDDPDEQLNAQQSFVVDGAETKIDSVVSSIHPNSWRQMSDRIYRVRGWNLDQFNTSKVEGLVDAEDVINDELVKIYDIIGFLARVGDDICLAIMEVKGFTKPEGKKKSFHLSAKCSDLASTSSNSMVLGQMIKLVPSEKQDGYWEWAKEYIVPLGNSRGRGKKQSFTIEVPSYLIQPLTVNMVSYPTENRETRLRWALSAEDLEKETLHTWDSFSAECNSHILSFDSIPIIENSESLPYRGKDGRKSFTVRNVPNRLLTHNILLSPNKIVHCLICGVAIPLAAMRGHVGKHILWDMRGQTNEPSNSDTISSMGVMPCGFCGIEGCTTKLTNQGHTPVITSTCIYYHTAFDYQAASRGEADETFCSNIPIHCDLCPLSAEGEQQTVWKYNALMHILVDHEQFDSEIPNLCILPEIPISMQARIHISRAEEITLGIKEEHTMEARADFGLLNSDDFPPEVYSTMVGKRARTETQSTIKPPTKKLHL